MAISLIYFSEQNRYVFVSCI